MLLKNSKEEKLRYLSGRNILIGLFLLQSLISVGLFYGSLYQTKNIISTQNIYVTEEVALNYINPIKPDTYKTQIGQFIASHTFDFEVNPNNRIPFKNYKDVIDHLTNNQLYILKESYKKYWLITFLLSLGISLYWNYSQYLKNTSVSKKHSLSMVCNYYLKSKLVYILKTNLIFYLLEI